MEDDESDGQNYGVVGDGTDGRKTAVDCRKKTWQVLLKTVDK